MNTIPKLLLILAGLLLTALVPAQAQSPTYRVTGSVLDTTDQSAIVGAYVMVTQPGDSTAAPKIVATDVNGRFEIGGLTPRRYRIKVTYLGYRDYERSIRLREEDLNLGAIYLSETAATLNEVKVVGQVQQSQQKGDTTQFNAAAFKTNPDATAEELLQKMPGMTVQNGQVQAQGEAVQRVMVDGKQFFGEDATLALRNLPAEIIDKIEVFDRQSDQAQFTGFDDGNAQKTINIVTRSDRNAGQFGKIYGGYGSDDRYMAGGNLNIFNKTQRISIIGLSNNINQQNFASQDLAGVLGTSGNGGRGGGGGGRGGRGGAGGGGGGGGNAGNFLVGQQSGITNTNAFGLNYSDMWGKNLEVTGSYFFNRSTNANSQVTNRETFLSSGNQFYRENSNFANTNMNHRVNFRFEYKLNKNNSIIFTPGLNWQNNESGTQRVGVTTLAPLGTLLNETNNTRLNETAAFNFTNNLLWRHRFAKAGRTLSMNISTNLSNRDGEGSLYALNRFYNASRIPGDTIDQQSYSDSRNVRLGANINYTEPLSKLLQLQLGYNVSLSNSDSRNRTFHYVNSEEGYSRLDTLLSNTFDNQYLTHRAGVTLRANKKKFTGAVGLELQNAGLFSQQLFPRFNEVDQTFTNLLPNAFLMFRPSEGKNLRMFYRTSTNEPSITQLQNVINNSNPLFLTAGNPNLKQEYSHRVNIRYSSSDAKLGRNFFILGSANYTDNSITNSTFVAERPMILPNGLRLEQGAQLTTPVNLDGTWNTRLFVNYGSPIKAFKVNLNLNSGVLYNRNPGLINQQLNISNNYALSQGIVLSSNISPKLDFTVSFNGNYNIVRNSIQPQLDNNFFTQVSSARINWIFGKGFVFQTDVTNQSFRGLGQGFNQNFTLWNASLGKKFLKDNRGELKLTLFDILAQNNSISRNVTETFVEDVTSRVLTQYGMLTFTYTLRNFGKAPAPAPRRTSGDPGPGGTGGNWGGPRN
ncbi:outer membrane beta-barrel family protein [Telluribacter sp. SYSU D00476]|uniref:outer membrane beta-barrel family protein n=1 Tax=Telluribacter sp. SYSU D00476 TaxID=2811430 RepID=UPI001FF1699E|nr:outer membrane beta-barrel family protein [Telluribacter sp. SYSU D00476]